MGSTASTNANYLGCLAGWRRRVDVPSRSAGKHVRGARRPLALCLLLVAGCASRPGARSPEHEQTGGGHRPASRAERTIENRPPPWAKEHGPFSADRMDLARSRERRRQRGEHAALHRHQASVLTIEALPSCVGLQSLHRCPLLAYEWTLDLVPGGVQLRARLPVGRAKILLEALHCHTAIGKRFDSRRDLCVLQDPAVQVSTTRNGQDVTLQLTSTGSSGVEELRERVSALVGRPAGR